MGKLSAFEAFPPTALQVPLSNSELDSCSRGFLDNPYSWYSRLRATNPVCLSARGIWLLTRYRDISAVLRDPRFARHGFAELVGDELAGSLLFQDPPRHTQLRSLIGKAFTSRAIQSLRRSIVEIANELIERIGEVRAMNLVADVALPLPVYAITEMLGVPSVDRELFLQWAIDLAGGREAESTSCPAFTRCAGAQNAISAYFRDLIVERQKRPQADLVSSLIAAEWQQERLTESELLATCSLMFVAGHETTVSLIGNGMLALLRHPTELGRLRANPQLLPQAIDELLRYDSPVQRVARMTTATVEIGGKSIPKGAIVFALVGAANRDPAQFTDPDSLDIARNDNRHLAFGRGARSCIGAPLARLEAEIAISALLRRFPKLSLTGRAPEWRRSIEVRLLKELWAGS
jgi:cytochrome P450